MFHSFRKVPQHSLTPAPSLLLLSDWTFRRQPKLLCVYLRKCVFVFMSDRSSSHSSDGGLVRLRSPKQISSSASCRLKSNCQNKDAERAFKRKCSIPSCVSVELFWGSLAGRVKVYFVFAVGPQHKASGSWLVKCWWRYYKVKSRVYKPAVCVVRAFPAEQWVSKLVWQWRRQTQREIEGERTRKWETVTGCLHMYSHVQNLLKFCNCGHGTWQWFQSCVHCVTGAGLTSVP